MTQQSEAQPLSPLPALQGSEKQIAWATDIRARIMAEVDDYALHGVGSYDRNGATEEEIQSSMERRAQLGRIAQYRAGRDFLARQDSARFWIDNRGINTEDFLGDRLRPLGQGIYGGIAQTDIKREEAR